MARATFWCARCWQAVGRAIKMHLRIVIPEVLLILGDGKAQIRDAALEALEKWVSEISLEPLLGLFPNAMSMEMCIGLA